MARVSKLFETVRTAAINLWTQGATLTHAQYQFHRELVKLLKNVRTMDKGRDKLNEIRDAIKESLGDRFNASIWSRTANLALCMRYARSSYDWIVSQDGATYTDTDDAHGVVAGDVKGHKVFKYINAALKEGATLNDVQDKWTADHKEKEEKGSKSTALSGRERNAAFNAAVAKLVKQHNPTAAGYASAVVSNAPDAARAALVKAVAKVTAE